MKTETTAKATPGPWKISNNIGRKSELGIVADAAPCIICVMGNAKAWPEEAHANAKLIAASPVMLTALKLAKEQIMNAPCTCNEDRDCLRCYANRKIKEAIEQAEG